MSATDWTVDRVLLEPKKAVALLNESVRLHRDANRRINDLLEANNRYLDRARAAETALATRSKSNPITASALADALACFWNAAIGEAHVRQSMEAMDVATVMAVGFAAVSARLAGEG